MRGIYQYPTTDRHYTTIQKSGGWILQYTDPLLDTTIFLAYRGPQELPDYTWEEAFYPRDSARFSPPHSLWVCVQKLQPGTHHFGAGFSADAAWEAACNAPTPQAQALEGSVITASEAAIYAAKRTLAVLKTPAGIYAGFPWFHQVWSRDELIALLGLPSDQQIAGIERYLTLTPQSGRLPTYIGSGTTCADGLGWLALVCREAADNCNTDLKTRITEYFQTALTDLIASHTDPKTGLITSGHNETWMDTIGREGCCVEIQAMAILVSELIDEWSNQSNWESWRAEMRSNIATWLVSDNVLADRTTPEGVRDDAVRPNVLLALLIDRNLVPRSTWDRTIELVLESCTTMWGGLSSLSQLHPAYMATSTGESNTSYHQGDSWLMMDGLSATALLRYNRELFGDIAKSIIRASTEEILWRHILGYVGEIRAAGDGGSWGTGVQAFSAGAYLLATAELQK
jgi:glycogen debranching enzyme